MNLWTCWNGRGWLPVAKPWRARGRNWLTTARALGLLLAARLLIAALPFRIWRGWLGGRPVAAQPADAAAARRLAAQVERAAWRLPFVVKCLPQAMALSWLLRSAGLPHSLVFAARPPGNRDGSDDLHAWVEVAGRIVLGDLPGPWLRLHQLGG